MKADISYYFDYLSPFSYFSWQWVRQELNKDKYNFKLYPVSLGKLLNHWGQKGPGEITPKREFLLKQCLRYGVKNNIPFTTPKTHPFNPLYALRASLIEISGSQQIEVIDALWRAGWTQGRDLGDPDELEKILMEANLPAKDIMDRASSPIARSSLKKNIEEALQSGVFGVPSFVVNQTELFWGNDSKEELMNYLEAKDLLDREKFKTLIDSTPRAALQSL